MVTFKICSLLSLYIYIILTFKFTEHTYSCLSAKMSDSDLSGEEGGTADIFRPKKVTDNFFQCSSYLKLFNTK